MSSYLNVLGSHVNSTSGKSAASKAWNASIGAVPVLKQSSHGFPFLKAKSSESSGNLFFSTSAVTRTQGKRLGRSFNPPVDQSRSALLFGNALLPSRNFHYSRSNYSKSDLDSHQDLGLNPAGPNAKGPSLQSILNPESPLFKNIICTYGEAGHQWLKSLPDRVDRLAKKWHLGNLSAVLPHEYAYNYVLLGNRASGQPIVLDRGWVSIDPKGLIGEPAYDCIPFINDSIQTEPYSTIQDRIKFFSNLFGVKEQRLHDWCYVHTVTSVCQCILDGLPGDHWGNSQQQISYFHNYAPSAKRSRI